MARGITLDISARVTGYEQSLQALRSALAKLNPGTVIANNVTKALQTAESKVKVLSQNLTPKVTNDSQLDKLVTKVNDAGDAVLNVSKLLQNIAPDDVNFASFGNQVDDLIQKIRNLETTLQENLSEGFTDFVKNSEEVKKSLQGMGLETKDIDIGNYYDVLSKKAEEAAINVEAADKRVKQAQQELAKKENSLQALKQNPIYNKDAVEQELQSISSTYVQAINNIKSQVETGLGSFGFSSKNQQKLLAAFTGGLSKDNLSQHIQDLMRSTREELQAAGTSMSANDVITKLFPSSTMGGAASGSAATLVLNKLFPDVNALKAEWQAKLQEISPALSTTQIGNIQTLISTGEIDKAEEETIKYIEAAYKKIAARKVQLQQEVLIGQGNVDAAQTDKAAAEMQSSNIHQTIDTLQSAVDNLKAQNQSLQHEIDYLKKERAGTESNQINELKDTGIGAGSRAENLKIAGDEAEKYGQKLEKVNERERTLGNFKSLITRWFSVQTVVRTVTQAVRSAVANIQELDKVITNIAVVTTMSQTDLWGRISQYTATAQEFGVAVRDVYTVSQIFYQQGLQTKQVMELTTETLKMAKIAGMDYAEAADAMTVAVRAFNLEMSEASRVTDVYSALAANFAVSSAEIANAMEKTASSAANVGMSIESTSAFMTVMVQTTRESAQNIGSALKSIISRYGELKKAPKDLITDEGEILSFNKVDTALRSVGISIKDANGQFRDFDDVIMELAGKWNTLDNNTQRYIATIMAFLCIRRRLVM